MQGDGEGYSFVHGGNKPRQTSQGETIQLPCLVYSLVNYSVISVLRAEYLQRLC
jgi:hypothetical protein